MIDWLWTRWERGTVVERERSAVAVAIAGFATMLFRFQVQECVEEV